MYITIDEKKLLSETMDEFAKRLSELGADTVQIVTTHMIGDGTGILWSGSGNYYGRKGSVEKWIEHCSGEDSAEQIAQKLDIGDDGEEWKDG